MLLSTLAMSAALPAPLESEDVVPVRTDVRMRGRFRKRSEEQPRFVLSAFGKDMTLNLIPDTSFIAPSFTVQRIRATDVGALRSAKDAKAVMDADLRAFMSQTEDTEGQLTGCFYSGNVDHDQDSVVAVSLCSGIFGSFISEGKEYLIEPKFGGGAGPDSTEQLHVIKRRTLTQRPVVSPPADRAAAETRGEEGFTHGGDAQMEPRRRRFVSAPRFIETLVVADSTMTHFYGDEIKVRHTLLFADSNINKPFLNVTFEIMNVIFFLPSFSVLPAKSGFIV